MQLIGSPDTFHHQVNTAGPQQLFVILVYETTSCYSETFLEHSLSWAATCLVQSNFIETFPRFVVKSGDRSSQVFTVNTQSLAEMLPAICKPNAL